MGRGARGVVRSPRLDLQVKATPTPVTEDPFPFDLPAKNYDELRSSAWQIHRILVVVVMPQDCATWVTATENELLLLDGERVTLEVPQRAASPDYPRVLGVLMDDLARIESRFPALILRDMRAAALDLIRISIVGSSTRDGRIPVEAGSRVYEAGRDMLLAAACSVLDPRPVFAKRKPEEAMSLLNRAKFGQTEVGSFVLTIECAVPPRLQPALVDDGDPEAPFERKVVVRLAHALSAAESASRKSAASGDIEPFRTRTADGISANLCDAIADMIDATGAEAVHAAFSFSSGRPLGAVVPRATAFSSDTSDILREAAKRLRDEATYPATEVVGTVVKLTSEDPASGGQAVVRADIEGRSRPVLVLMPLEAGSYETAIEAHRDRSAVTCTGDLARRGRSWILENPRNFSVVPDQE